MKGNDKMNEDGNDNRNQMMDAFEVRVKTDLYQRYSRVLAP